MDPSGLPRLTLYEMAPAWAIALVLLVAALGALEVGHRLSRVSTERGNLSALQAAVFGLATLLMAFSFSAAQVRFDERRVLAIQEANAIGTLYLRAGYLPPASRDEMRRLLRRYLEVHLELVLPDRTRAQVARLLEENGRIQSQLWGVLEGQAQALPAPVLILVTPALNDVIDISAQRWSTALARLPWLVTVMLFTVILASALLVSYRPGSAGRSFPQWALFLVTSVMVMLTLLDLDRPPMGFIRTSQQPLLELRETLRASPP